MSTLLASPRLAFLKKDSYMTRLIIVFLLLLIFFAAVRPGPFFAVRTWQSMAVQFPEFGLMSLGVMFTMFTAGIDLSVVAIANVTVNLRGPHAARHAHGGLGRHPRRSAMATLIALGVALVVGVVCGLINGMLVAVLKIPPILATLGTLELFGGVALILTQGKPVSGVPRSVRQPCSPGRWPASSPSPSSCSSCARRVAGAHRRLHGLWEPRSSCSARTTPRRASRA